MYYLLAINQISEYLKIYEKNNTVKVRLFLELSKVIYQYKHKKGKGDNILKNISMAKNDDDYDDDDPPLTPT